MAAPISRPLIWRIWPRSHGKFVCHPKVHIQVFAQTERNAAKNLKFRISARARISQYFCTFSLPVGELANRPRAPALKTALQNGKILDFYFELSKRKRK